MTRDANSKGASTCEVREPDEMGCWADAGDVVWLPRSRYPRRIDAIRWAMDEWGVTLPEVCCLSRWLRFVPREWEERWIECERDEPGAFRVWRLESA